MRSDDADRVTSPIFKSKDKRRLRRQFRRWRIKISRLVRHRAVHHFVFAHPSMLVCGTNVTAFALNELFAIAYIYELFAIAYISEIYGLPYGAEIHGSDYAHAETAWHNPPP